MTKPKGEFEVHQMKNKKNKPIIYWVAHMAFSENTKYGPNF